MYGKNNLAQHEGNPKKFGEQLKPLVHDDNKSKTNESEIELDG